MEINLSRNCLRKDTKSQLVSKVRSKLYELGKGNSCTLRWVTGYTSIRDNETADTLVKAEAGGAMISPVLF